jgi:hypothetical protein
VQLGAFVAPLQVPAAQGWHATAPVKPHTLPAPFVSTRFDVPE